MCGCLSAFYAAFSRHGTNVFNNRFSGTLLHPLGSFSAPQEPQAVPYKQLIILPITLVFGSSHSVLPQHLQLGAPRFAGRRGGFGESSFSFERCNQTFNSQLTAAFFCCFFFYIHTHIWPVWTWRRDLSQCVKEGGNLSSHFFCPRLRSTVGDVWEKKMWQKFYLTRSCFLRCFFYKFSASEQVAVIKNDGQMNNCEIFPIQVPRFRLSPNKTLKREKRREEADPNTHQWPQEGELLGELIVGCKFCTEPVSSCLCCSAFISDADLTGCDRASQERALQEYLKDATRSFRIWRAFQMFISQFIESGGFFLIEGEGSCFQRGNRNEKVVSVF